MLDNRQLDSVTTALRNWIQAEKSRTGAYPRQVPIMSTATPCNCKIGDLQAQAIRDARLEAATQNAAAAYVASCRCQAAGCAERAEEIHVVMPQG